MASTMGDYIYPLSQKVYSALSGPTDWILRYKNYLFFSHFVVY